MNKTTCCGCFGAGCLIIIIAVTVGGYFGVNFLYDSGKELAADGLRESVIKMAEMAYAPEERTEITDLAEEAAVHIRSGEIGLVELFKEATQHLETNLHVKALLLGFARKVSQGKTVMAEAPESDNFSLPAESPELQINPEVGAAVQRVISGMIENKITSSQLASITAAISEHYTEKVGTGEGKTQITRSSRRLKLKMSAEDLASSIQLLHKICDESKVEVPDAGFDASSVVKKEFITVLTNLNKLSKNR